MLDINLLRNDPDKVREKNRRYWAKRALKRLDEEKEVSQCGE